MADVFISYSRANSVFAHKLAAELKKLNYEVWVDIEGIAFTSKWWQEIQRGIEAADNFVLVMSPDSLGSPVCHLEIEYARKLNKRIIPVNHIAVSRKDAADRINKRIVEDAYITELVGDRSPIMLFNTNWQEISGINWFDYPYSEDNPQAEQHFYEKLPPFVEALEFDLLHVRQHTRHLTRSKEWLSNNQNRELLLFGNDVTSAEKWLGDWEGDTAERAAKGQPPKAPAPTDEIRQFITASRLTENERQQQLAELETSRQRSDAAARNARRILTAVALASAAILIGVVALTSNQVSEAQDQVATATVQQGQAQQDAANARTEVAVIGITATLVPPTLTQAGILRDDAEQSAGTAIAQVATATVQQGEAEQNAAAAQTEVAFAGATATQIPPTLTQAAVLREEALIDREIVGIFSNIVIASDTNSNYVISQMSEIIEKYPNETLAYQSRGILFRYRGELDRAIEDFTQAIILDPQNSAAYNNRGLTYYEQGDLDSAIKDYNQVITLDPMLVEVYINRSIVYCDKEEYNNAIADLNQALKLDPQNVTAYMRRGITYVNMVEPDLALADFEKALELDPQDPEAYYNRGIVYYLQGDIELALQDFNQAIAFDLDDSNFYFMRGLAYAAQQEIELALSDFNQAITLNPEDGEIYYNRGMIYTYLGESDLAIADYEQAMILDPRDANTYYNGGASAFAEGQFDLAIAYYNQTLKLEPKNVNVYYDRGITYTYLGDIDRAIDDYNQVIEIDPQFERAYSNLGAIYLSLQQFERAIENFTHAIDLDSSYLDPYLGRAYAYYSINKPTLALADFEQYEALGGVLPPDFQAIRDEVEMLVAQTATP